MLEFEDEIMKRRDSVHEVRASRVLTKLGLMEEGQYGSTAKKRGHGNSHLHSCIGN